jgi:hypothetical protein
VAELHGTLDEPVAVPVAVAVPPATDLHPDPIEAPVALVASVATSLAPAPPSVHAMTTGELPSRRPATGAVLAGAAAAAILLFGRRLRRA